MPLLLAILLTLLPSLARAQTPLSLEAVPVLGPTSPSVDGWGQLYLRLENSGDRASSGFLELRAESLGRGGFSGGSRGGPAGRALSRAPFAVAAKSRVTLLLPTHSLVTRMGGARVVAVDNEGSELCGSRLAPMRTLDPLLFDLTEPSRLAAALNGAPMPIRRRAYGYAYGGATLSVATPQRNLSTGELVLPDLAAGYASATLVLATGRTLATLTPAAQDALFSWVLGGGALAIVLDRPEDVHSPWLEALAGGRVHATAASQKLSQMAPFAVRLDGKTLPGGEPRFATQSAQPSAELAATFVGFGGANLRVSPWGEAASYGLGEVHLLAFNPDGEVGALDTWARLEIVDLIRHAWDRASVVALPHGQAGLDDSRLSGVRRVLDPNESTRWTVVVSALLLLLYAALAGPLNFFLAQRRGRPLRALLYLPVWAGLALGGIVILGILGKGVSGRARHLTLIESGAGMTRAAVTRFRGLYGSAADDLLVRATRGSVLDVTGDPSGITRDLVVDRDGLRLERLREKPWEVEVVREDGFADLGAGISMLLDAGGSLAIKNRTGRDLLSVVIKLPRQAPRYFSRIRDGQTVGAAHGRELVRFTLGASAGGAHPLSVDGFRTEAETEAKGISAAWDALEAVAGSEVDWWPEDVPILLGEIEGGEGRTVDSGLRLDIDRVLVRVIGYGGLL